MSPQLVHPGRLGRPRRVGSGPSVIAYSELVDLGFPQAESVGAGGGQQAYWRNPWVMHNYGGLIFVGCGNSGGSGFADPNTKMYARAIDTSDDSLVTVPLATESEDKRLFTVEISTMTEIDGDFFILDADSYPNIVECWAFQLVEGEFVAHRVCNSVHLYDLQKSLRNGMWFASHGRRTELGVDTEGRCTPFNGLGALPRNSYDEAPNFAGYRGAGVMEFGDDGNARLVSLSLGNCFVNERLRTGAVADESVTYGTGKPRVNYEYNYESDTFSPVSQAIFRGLDEAFASEWQGPNDEGDIVTLAVRQFKPWKIRRWDANTYLMIVGKSYSQDSGGPRWMYPGMIEGYDPEGTGFPDNIAGCAAGGVYWVTLTDQPPYAACWTNGGTHPFLQCDRALDPAISGRQWEYKIHDGKLFILSETPDGVIHVWRVNAPGSPPVEVLRVEDAPTFARSFEIVGKDVYLGLGTEINDPYRDNGTTVNANSGRVVKAAGVL